MTGKLFFLQRDDSLYVFIHKMTVMPLHGKKVFLTKNSHYNLDVSRSPKCQFLPFKVFIVTGKSMDIVVIYSISEFGCS